MRKTASVPCGHPGCRRNTTHRTGRCHDHRNHAAATNPVAALVSPPTSAWGNGVVKEDLPDGSVRRTETTFGHTKVEYLLDGEPHRLDGPAKVARDGAGRVKDETYARNGAVHRVDGPAIIEYDVETGKPTIEIYSFRRESAQDPAFFAAILSTYSNEVLTEEFEASSYRPLIEEGHPARKIVDVIGRGVRTVGGIREVLGGAPVEWVRSYEEGSSS